MIKAAIFDLNGLFVKSDEWLSVRIEKDYGVPHNIFVPILDRVLNEARNKGIEDSFVLWEPELKKLGINLGKEEFWKYWFEKEYEVPEMLNLASELKTTGLKVFILTNNFKERRDYYQKNFSFAQLKTIADKIYFSADTGFIKPDPRAWLNILSENELQPAECIYFDNSPNNVDAAKNLGITSYLFRDTQDAKEKIYSLLK